MIKWLQTSRQQSAVLRRIIDRVRSSLELKVVLQTAVDEIADVFKLDRCSFFWYFHDTNRVQVICESQLSVESSSLLSPQISFANQPFRLGYFPIETFGTVSRAIAQGEMVITHSDFGNAGFKDWLNYGCSSRRQDLGANPSILGAVATMMVPLKTQNGSIGFIACLSDRPRRWTDLEIDLLQAIAQQLEIALEHAQLYEQTQKQAQRERLVNQITAQTRQSFELEMILRSAIAQLLEALQVDRCIVHLVEEAKSVAEFSSYRSGFEAGKDVSSSTWNKHLYEVCRPPFAPSVEEFDTNGPITRWVIENRRRVVISDITTDQRIGVHNPEYEKAEIKSSLVIPVQTKDKLYAILYLNQCSEVRYWSKNDQKLALAVADQLAISIQQAHLYAQTQQQAIASAAQAKHLAETLDELRLTQAQLIQSEKMSSLGRVVAGIAHEINNPVNFISGNLPYVENYVHDLIHVLNAYRARVPDAREELQQLAEEIELDFLLADLPRILTSMKVGANRIREIVLSLRNFSRLDEAHYKQVNIHEGIESTLVVLQSYIGENIRIIRDYGDLPEVECHPRQLNQVFMNILMNAVEALKAWQGAEKTISICTGTVPLTDSQKPMVRIVITDNGPGMPHEIQSQIFDPFFTTKPVGQGTGLGLTVSYQTIVNQHQGRLKFYSEPGLGAEFMIEIPVRLTSDVRQEHRAEFAIGA